MLIFIFPLYANGNILVAIATIVLCDLNNKYHYSIPLSVGAIYAIW